MHQSITTQTGVNILISVNCGKLLKRGRTGPRIAETRKKKTLKQKNKQKTKNKKQKTKIKKVKKTKNKTLFFSSHAQKKLKFNLQKYPYSIPLLQKSQQHPKHHAYQVCV